MRLSPALRCGSEPKDNRRATGSSSPALSMSFLLKLSLSITLSVMITIILNVIHDVVRHERSPSATVAEFGAVAVGSQRIGLFAASWAIQRQLVRYA